MYAHGPYWKDGSASQFPQTTQETIIILDPNGVEETSFTIGDRVQLMSDGPTMTVERIEDCRLCCCWFDRDEHLVGQFPSQGAEAEF